MAVTPKFLVAFVSCSLLFSGCSSPATEQAATPAPTETTTATPTSPEIKAASPAEALMEFQLASERSCLRAMTEGVTEVVGDGALTLVMVSEDQAIESYSAAYFEPGSKEPYVLVFETDVFAVCGAYVSFALAEEAGVVADIAVELQPDGSFFVVQDFGEFGVQGQSYELEDGYFTTVSTSFGDDIRTSVLTYGPPTSENYRILETAFQEFFG